MVSILEFYLHLLTKLTVARFCVCNLQQWLHGSRETRNQGDTGDGYNNGLIFHMVRRRLPRSSMIRLPSEELYLNIGFTTLDHPQYCGLYDNFLILSRLVLKEHAKVEAREKETGVAV